MLSVSLRESSLVDGLSPPALDSIDYFPTDTHDPVEAFKDFDFCLRSVHAGKCTRAIQQQLDNTVCAQILSL
jgi:hypothetical protein